MRDSDRKILEEVAEAITRAEEINENWVDHLPAHITSEPRYESDPWYIGTLQDGRTIWLRDESAHGADQYGISDAD